MEKIQKQIDAFLKRATIIKAEMRRHEAGMLITDQINESLIFISPKASYVYEMTYVNNYVNRAKGIEPGQLLWHDYILVPIRECNRKDNPELFLEILKSSMKIVPHRAYEIFVDGKHLKKMSTFGRAKSFVYELKRAANNAMDERYQSFKNMKRIWIVDPAGNKTWFIMDSNPTYAHYNPF